MLFWALCFLVIAVISGLLGFTGIVGATAWVAQLLFVVFLFAFAIVMTVRSVTSDPLL